MNRDLKKFLSCILVVLMLLGNITVNNSLIAKADYTEGSFTYIIVNNSSAYITGYTTNDALSENLVIPSVLGGKEVTNISNGAFQNCDIIKTVEIPDSVTTLGDSAFSGCSNLVSVTLPDTINDIPEKCFYSCSSLESITLPDSIEYIDAQAFSMCDSLTSIDFGNSLLDIGVEAFYSCDSLLNLDFPDTVRWIEANAFDFCINLKNVKIGADLKYIDSVPFMYCDALESINVDASNPYFSSIDGLLFNKDQTTLIKYPGSKISDYVIPDTVTTVKEYAFYSADGLKSIVIPDTVSTIEEYAFRGSALTKATVGNSITIIDNYVFVDCENLTEVKLPDSLTSIGDYVFSGCTGLKEIIIPDSVTVIGNGAFLWCSSLESVELSKNITSVGSNSFWCNDAYDATTSLEKIVFYNPETVIYDSSGTITETTVIYGYTGSTAHDYALKYDRPFVSLGEYHEHVYSSSIIEATCTTDGYTYYACTCGDTYTEDITNALGHAMGTWIETVAPTCTEKGEERSDCSRCDYYEAREVAATGHNDENNDGYCDDEDCKENICEHTDVTLTGKKEATCTANGYTGDKVCDKCGETTVTGTATTALGHAMGEWVVTKAPTCTEKGEERSDCSRCDYYETRNVDAKGHEDKDNDGYCDDEDCKENICEHTDVTLISKKEATCTVGGYTGDKVCDKCGVTTETGTATTALGHAMGEWTETKAPTCTEKGEERSDCSRCDYYETRNVDAKGHEDKDNDGYCDDEDCKENICTHENVTLTGKKEATCTANGYTGDKVCDKCGVTTEAGTATNVLGHNLGEWIETIAPTCTEKGEERSDCSRCDYYETREVAEKGHEDNDNDGYCDDEDCKENICEHTDVTLTGKKEATCTVGGYTGDKVCDKCGVTTETGTVTNALGHNLGEWIETKAPTCTEKGEERSDCSRCDYYETREVAATGHNDEDNDGYCDDEDCKENICEHTDTTLIGKADATCTANGYTGDKVCDKCGVTTETGTATNALGHAMSEWVETVAPTCTEKGEERSDCSRCDYYETREVAATGHNDEDDDGYCDDEDCKENICEHTDVTLISKKEATCTANGYTGDKVCDKCGVTTETGTATNALGHAMSEWVETVAPTCTEKGEERSDCSRCDYYETREIASTGHKDENNDGKCDDCDENVCKHEDKDADGKCDGCDGDYSQISKKCLCFCHSTNIFIRIIYIICRLIFKIFNVHRICACGQYHF